jgi:glycerol-3-phosphate dehydrogenase (NAD(P)+)
MNTTIIGAGAYGTALSTILNHNHHTTTLYDPIKNLTTLPPSPAATIIAIPSQNIPSVIPLLPTTSPIILATKGLFTLHQFGHLTHHLSILSGPAFAANLIAKTPTTLTATKKIAQALFTTDFLNIELTPDTIGVLTCGSLKNIYAIGAGLLHLTPDTRAHAVYIAKSIAEIETILIARHADPATAYLSCGLADLLITCTPESRNYQFGAHFPHPATTTTEGLTSLKTYPKNLPHPPILHAIHQTIINHNPTPIPL